MTRNRFFHGGQPGLKVGEYVEPHGRQPGWKIDDCPLCESGADDSHMPDTVFVTQTKEYARFYASRAMGDLYVVEPVGLLVPSDNDVDIPSWSCERALVVRIYDRNVRLTRQQRWQVFRMMSPAGEHPATTRLKYDEMERQAHRLAAETRRRKAMNT